MNEGLQDWVSTYSAPGAIDWDTENGIIPAFSVLPLENESDFQRLWDVYVKMLGKHGLSELREIREYLDEQIKVDLESAESIGTRLTDDDNAEWIDLEQNEAASVKFSIENQLEAVELGIENLRLRVVVVENVIWRYCIFGETQYPKGDP